MPNHNFFIIIIFYRKLSEKWWELIWKLPLLLFLPFITSVFLVSQDQILIWCKLVIKVYFFNSSFWYNIINQKI